MIGTISHRTRPFIPKGLRHAAQGCESDELPWGGLSLVNLPCKWLHQVCPYLQEEKEPTLWQFAWQNGYGVFSIGCSQVQTVRTYIAQQEEHHRRVSFQDEFRRFLKRDELAYNEAYVWD